MDHLVERGYRRLAFAGVIFPRDYRAEQRHAGFLDEVARYFPEQPLREVIYHDRSLSMGVGAELHDMQGIQTLTRLCSRAMYSQAAPSWNAQGFPSRFRKPLRLPALATATSRANVILAWEAQTVFQLESGINTSTGGQQYIGALFGGVCRPD